MKNAKILWIDLEMTGLNPQKDRILEVAAIATDWDFNEIATFESAVKVDEKILKIQFIKIADLFVWNGKNLKKCCIIECWMFRRGKL